MVKYQYLCSGNPGKQEDGTSSEAVYEKRRITKLVMRHANKLNYKRRMN